MFSPCGPVWVAGWLPAFSSPPNLWRHLLLFGLLPLSLSSRLSECGWTILHNPHRRQITRPAACSFHTACCLRYSATASVLGRPHVQTLAAKKILRQILRARERVETTSTQFNSVQFNSKFNADPVNNQFRIRELV